MSIEEWLDCLESPPKNKPTVEELQAILDGPPDDTVCFPNGVCVRASEIPFGYQVIWSEYNLETDTAFENTGRWNGKKLCIVGTPEYLDVCNEMARRIDVLWKINFPNAG